MTERSSVIFKINGQPHRTTFDRSDYPKKKLTLGLAMRSMLT